MKLECVWEHNGDDSLLWAAHFPGAFTRGESKQIAIDKMRAEIFSFLCWTGSTSFDTNETIVEIVQERSSDLAICDADSDVIFENEKVPLTYEEYHRLKKLALQSAEDFLNLYASIPDKNVPLCLARNTFYGSVPRSANEMYEHTKNVNSYYFTEIGINADNNGTILDCRRRGFEALETIPDYLSLPPTQGSYGEFWSLRKVLRRFLWHDRIHAKAMHRNAIACFQTAQIANPFFFT